jgi:hypothetical protein
MAIEHSAKHWAAATYYVLDELISELTERGVLSPESATAIASRAMAAMQGNSDQDIRGGAALLKELYNLGT